MLTFICTLTACFTANVDLHELSVTVVPNGPQSSEDKCHEKRKKKKHTLIKKSRPIGSKTLHTF